MGEKIKMFGALAFIGVIGFLLGIAANFVYFKALPTITKIFPMIIGMDWVMWGIVGGFLAVVCCLIYAYLP